MFLHVFTIRTPLGWMAAAWSEIGLRVLVLPQNSRNAAMEKLAEEMRIKPSLLPTPVQPSDVAPTLTDEIDRYFQGEKVTFYTTIDWSGYTPFQRRILLLVKAIRHGEVRSYKQVASEAGCPRAARAVGGVMRSNRTPLLIPCHRVLAANGSLGGFSGGLDMKKRLLELEQVRSRNTQKIPYI
ncbi:MAG: Methylated-DNA--protein-cysteine methyltransferase [Pelotomaculum sp. PtaU1.Bin035]|nr:MAG: Methylated-DNA--protein-cysteine methyltransferase [Pelotomaculum sp. PtaU1.Bin035]